MGPRIGGGLASEIVEARGRHDHAKLAHHEVASGLQDLDRVSERVAEHVDRRLGLRSITQFGQRGERSGGIAPTGRTSALASKYRKNVGTATPTAAAMSSHVVAS